MFPRGLQMTSIRIWTVLFFVILAISSTVSAHEKEEADCGSDKVTQANFKNENSLQTKSNLHTEFDHAHTNKGKYLQKYVPCKEGWILYGEKCYQWFHRFRKTWKEAADSCEEEGGHLATISSKELLDYIITFLMLNNKWDSWIGLNDLDKESEYSWHDGSDLNFTNWGPGEPSSKSERCVEMIFGNPHLDPPPKWGKLGIWNDASCYNIRPYICQVDRNKDPRFCSMNEGGGFKHADSCFNIVRTKKSWDDAEKHCKENFKGHLVTIVDKIVELYLNYILKDGSEDLWIGIKRQGGVGIQKWNSGFHLVFNRLNRTLNEIPVGTCVFRTKEGFWTNANCSMELPFICERTRFKDPIFKKAPKGWQCPRTSKEWTDLEGEFCYIFGKNRKLNWNEANADCKKKSGTLASITSQEENMILGQYAAIYLGEENYIWRQGSVFIGLRRNPKNKKQFEWIDGSKFVYTNWDLGEPNHLGESEECGEMLSVRNAWNDVGCGIKNRTYICKTKKVAPPKAILKTLY